MTPSSPLGHSESVPSGTLAQAIAHRDALYRRFPSVGVPYSGTKDGGDVYLAYYKACAEVQRIYRAERAATLDGERISEREADEHRALARRAA